MSSQYPRKPTGSKKRERLRGSGRYKSTLKKKGKKKENRGTKKLIQKAVHLHQNHKHFPPAYNPHELPHSTTTSNPEMEFDRLSDLPEPLLLHILSFLSTKFAIRTSLLSRRFRDLWTASPSIDIDRRDFPPGRVFTDVTSRCLRVRDSSAPLVTFRLNAIGSHRNLAIKTASRWLKRAYSLGLRNLHLDIYADDFQSLLPLIVTFHSLQCLKVWSRNYDSPVSYYGPQEPLIPANFLATGLRSLHLKTGIHCADLKRLVREQTHLEDLCLELCSRMTPVDLVSTTVKNTKLIFHWSLPGLNLFFPALVALDLTIRVCYDLMKFHAEMPLLRKADIKISRLAEDKVPLLSNFLRCLINVSQLSINIQRACPRKPDLTPALRFARRRKLLENRQFHLLVEPGKDLSTFTYLRSLKFLMHFHEDGISDLICFLQNAPVLESVELHHVVNDEASWKSRLPQDSEGNNQHAHFSNLHLDDTKIELIRLLVSCKERHQKKPRHNDLEKLKK